MKTLYVTANYESVQPHLVEALREVGVDARMFYHTRGKKKTRTGLPENETVIRWQSPVTGKGPLLYMTRMRLAAKACLQHCRKERPDVLHGNMLFADGYICRFVADRLKMPYVVSVRNADLNMAFLWKLPWLRRMGLKNLDEADSVLFLSAVYRDKLLTRLPKALAEQVKRKSLIVPNGIDLYYLEHPHMHESSPHEPVRLIFVGKINALKNLETVLSAMDILRERSVSTELTVVGPIVDESYRPLVTGKEDVHYLGKLPMEQVCEQYREADIFVVPSHTESFGLVYAEAISQGLPVIYTRGQGFDGQFPDGTVGYAVSDKDPEEIADKIEAILKDYAAISERCTKGSARFNWQRIAKQLLEQSYSSAGRERPMQQLGVSKQA